MPERECFFQKISRVYDGFTNLNDEQKLSIILTNNVYLGLEIFYIGPLRNEICSEAVASVSSFIYAQNVRTCIYVHMHKCAKMVILVMINPARSLRSCTY